MKRHKFYSVTLIIIFISFVLLKGQYKNLISLFQYQDQFSKANKNIVEHKFTPLNIVPESYSKQTNKQLIWSDEFDKKYVNTKKWNIVDWAATKNNELQYYNPKNISIYNGSLRIISKKESLKNREYTSGAIETKGKLDLLYGKIEIRARLPKGQGLFPAFWLLPSDDSYLPEIDIMEMLGHETNKIWMVYHWFSNTGTQERDYSFTIGPDFSEYFHIFTLEWSPEKLVWYIDDEEVFSVLENIPNKPLYLYINTAIGGDWPKDPDATTQFPQYLDVDYIRVYNLDL